MLEILKAIRYRNLEEGRRVLRQALPDFSGDIFDDGGAEPQGLLAVIPQDRLPEELFYRLFDIRKGTFVEVEKIPYAGYGPPAHEDDYMGFIAENRAYVLKGCRYAIEIENCPYGARDIHHLEALVHDNLHPINPEHLARKLDLPADWDFCDLLLLIAEGRYTGDEIDRLTHQSIHGPP